MVQPIQRGFEAIPPDVRDAAACCGLTPRQRFFQIELPLAWPGVLTAAILTFAHTLGEFGVVLMVRALRTSESIEGGLSLRALLILPVALCLFGFLLDRAGFIPAMLVIVIGSALAGREFRFLEVLALAVFLTVVSVGIFIFGLGLPYPLYVIPHIPGF